MKKHIFLIIFVFWSIVYLNILAVEMHQDIKQLQAQVTQLNIEVMQSNRNHRELWEAQEKLLWVSQDIDQRLLRAEGRGVNAN